MPKFQWQTTTRLWWSHHHTQCNSFPYVPCYSHLQEKLRTYGLGFRFSAIARHPDRHIYVLCTNVWKWVQIRKFITYQIEVGSWELVKQASGITTGWEVGGHRADAWWKELRRTWSSSWHCSWSPLHWEEKCGSTHALGFWEFCQSFLWKKLIGCRGSDLPYLY